MTPRSHFKGPNTNGHQRAALLPPMKRSYEAKGQSSADLCRDGRIFKTARPKCVRLNNVQILIVVKHYLLWFVEAHTGAPVRYVALITKMRFYFNPYPYTLC